MNYKDHDDLCPMKHEQWPKHPLEKCWQCDLIAIVRQDMLAKVIDRMTDTDLDDLVNDDDKDVIFAAFRALQEQP